MNTTTKKGFTLVELLIVIGILAVLATTAVVILNPAQLLAQARDSQRLSDMGSINSALALYTTDVALSSQDLNAAGVNTALCSTTRAATSGSYQTAAPLTNSFQATAATRTNVNVTARTVAGAGWLPVDFTLIGPNQSPIATLPVDPTNTGGTSDLVYRYACQQQVAFTAGTYEIDACLESTKYIGYMATDGGDSNGATCATPGFYETGTNLAL